MSGFGRKAMRRAALAQARNTQEDVGEVKKLLRSAKNIKNLNDAIQLIADVAPAIEECRTACTVMIVEVQDLKRDLARERYIRESMFDAFTAKLPSAPHTAAYYSELFGKEWDALNPLPAPEAPVALLEGSHAAEGGA